MNRRNRFIQTVIVAALIALCLPALAAAQGTYDPYGRPDDRRNRDEDYRGNDGRYDRYDRNTVRNSINRLNNLAHDFQEDLDRALDHSREDGTRHEDHLNADVKDFHRSIHSFKERFDDGRDLNQSANEARRVLDIGSHVEDAVSHHFNNYRLASEWSQIRRELNIIADVYGYNMNSYHDGRDDRNDDYNDGRYGRNDDNRRRNRNRNNDQWWRRWPN